MSLLKQHRDNVFNRLAMPVRLLFGCDAARPAPGALIPQTSSPITALPTELVYLISEHLPLHDKFFLSQTCRKMRLITWENWHQRLGKLCDFQKIDFWMGVGNILVDNWVCTRCCTMHPIDTSDTPQSIRHRVCCPATAPTLGLGDLKTLGRYQIRHNHVQLALKYSRLGAHHPYLQKLLAKYTEESQTSETVYSAEPRVEDDHFLLFEKRIFRVDKTNPWCGYRWLWPSICPHLSIPLLADGSFPDRQRPLKETLDLLNWFNEFEAMIARAFALAGSELRGSCNHCPTDYSIHVCKKRHCVVIKAWRDFGTYDSPYNPTWSSQKGEFYPSPLPWDQNNTVRGNVREQFEKRDDEVVDNPVPNSDGGSKRKLRRSRGFVKEFATKASERLFRCRKDSEPKRFRRFGRKCKCGPWICRMLPLRQPFYHDISRFYA